MKNFTDARLDEIEAALPWWMHEVDWGTCQYGLHTLYMGLGWPEPFITRDGLCRRCRNARGRLARREYRRRQREG